MKKSTQLKNMLQSDNLDFIMEAHNGLSAKIVEETGFKGIWASGLSISASLGVRDNNEASWTQIMDIMEFMSDASSLPILLDGDTGYGNFNNMRRLVKKLEQRDIAGVCIEDKLFPKTNSFIGGEAQPLADMDEFCGKIRAAKEAQTDPDFNVIARVEAFIAGWGTEEALRRAEAYRLAGADAIFMHSKKTDCSDIDSFMKLWENRHPVVLAPSKYFTTPTDHFRALGINLVIWANQNCRSSITAMQKTSRKIFMEECLNSVEGELVPVSEIFRLQGAEELKNAEKMYLPVKEKNVSSIILAASKGNLGELTKDIPKTLLKINGQEILKRQINSFNHVGIKDISVVRGFKKEKINYQNISFFDNDQHETTGELVSLMAASEKLSGNTVISYGDIVFKDYILNELLNDDSDITLIVDAEHQVDNRNNVRDMIETDIRYSKTSFLQTIRFKQMGTNLSSETVSGEFIGLWKTNEQGAEIVRETLNKLKHDADFHSMTLEELFNEIAIKHTITVKFIKGSWLDIDTILDLQKAEDIH